MSIKLMADRDIGSLLVMDAGALVGIITERHYARDVMLRGRTSPQTLVRDVMETQVPCAEPGQTIEACLALMTQERVPQNILLLGGALRGSEYDYFERQIIKFIVMKRGEIADMTRDYEFTDWNALTDFIDEFLTRAESSVREGQFKATT